MKFYTAVVFSTLVSAVLAFENTVPCIMWSPKDYIKTNGRPHNQLVITNADATSSITSSLSSDICSAKAIALFDQPEIHSNDFVRSENKNAFNNLRTYIDQASTRSEIEYIAGGVGIQKVAQMIASECEATVVNLDASDVSDDDFKEQSSPIVVVASLPSSNSFHSNDVLLKRFISVMERKVNQNYAVIYTSGSAKTFENEYVNLQAPSNKSLPIFAKYQLFTPGVFMVLGVTLLFLFIAGTGITWLSGIQTPIRMEAPKQKKN
ncbi:hypothetical protein G6F57_007788 [Rhizopus arrhizus]|nr:hypothetical protein G6F30_002011 [Rhizopus arrhizus]KAG1420489.1 hypothetical protein G6F58_004163 [Rhizopus delemar]KAG0980195.1 hypothetical protein G6F29_008004 [Rhizopus arrhizus]KAG0998732.1 hypothetical protein G6F28_001664 [Rhizopus arrhizus]KAG1006294.1 hypothetical protein G6F27_008444 [Rhizopus arrhizus]